MNNSMEILNRIEKMLQEKHISVETMTHLEWIQARSAGKQFSMSEHIRAMIYSLLTNNRRWDQVERNIEEIDKIFFDYDKERILNTPPEFFVEQIQKIKVNGRTVRSMLS